METEKQKIVIVGMGETAELAFDYFTNDSPYEVKAFAAEKKYLDANPGMDEKENLPVVALEDMERLFPPGEYLAFVAMSYVKLNHDRARFYELVKNKGYICASYVSTQAFIGANVTIGENCFIFENNVLQRNVIIGNDVILWSGNHIGHRTVIEDHVFLSSHVAVSGFCRIGAYCFLGINSALGDNVTIGENCFIGGGVALMRDTKKNEIYRAVAQKPERLSTKAVFGLDVGGAS